MWGLLGSPSFEIPRTVERDAKLALGPEELRRGLAAKNRHNLTSILLLVLSRWVDFTLMILLARYALDLWGQFGVLSIAVLGVAELLLNYTFYILLDAMVRWLKAYAPQVSPSTTGSSRGTSATGRSRPTPTSSGSTAPRSRAACGGCSG